MASSCRCAFRFLPFAAACLLVSTPAAAQWRAEMQAGRLRYDAAPEAVATSIAAGLSHATPSTTIAASVGAPFTREEPVWLALQGATRFVSDGRMAFGLDAGADAFGFHLSAADSSIVPLLGGDEVAITGWGAAVEVMPFTGWYGARVDAEARAGFVSFLSDGSHVERMHRTSFVTDAMLQTASWRTLSARLDGRWVQAPEGGFPFVGVMIMRNGPLSLWGSLGRWFDAAAESMSWSAGAALSLGSRTALLVNGEHEEIDPIYATPARTTWGLGLRILLGTVGSVRQPVPDAYANGVATIRLDVSAVPGAGTPMIAGDFNNWAPEPMTQDAATGSWIFRTALEPGVYHYAFVDGAGSWFVPEDTPGRRSDGMGGHVAVLVVEDA